MRDKDTQRLCNCLLNISIQNTSVNDLWKFGFMFLPMSKANLRPCFPAWNYQRTKCLLVAHLKVESERVFVLGWFQICSAAEKVAIDKMIDSGPQLAGSMEYNVVLSECHRDSFSFLENHLI